MDPNLFHIDWERTIEALVGIIIIAFLVERACALLFESRWWITRFEDARVSGAPGKKANAQKVLAAQSFPLKESISFLVALVVCYFWSFDSVSIILLSEHTSLIGIVVTALVVAGGSKASIALFQQALHIKSSATDELKSLKEQDKKAKGLI